MLWFFHLNAPTHMKTAIPKAHRRSLALLVWFNANVFSSCSSLLISWSFCHLTDHQTRIFHPLGVRGPHFENLCTRLH